MQKISILGSGYIGSELCYSLDKSYKINCIDHGKNFSILKKYCPRTTFVKSDIKDENILKKYTENSNVIFYCLNNGGVYDAMNNSSKYKKIILSDFTKLTQIIKRTTPHCLFYLFSSGYVYSKNDKIPVETDVNPDTLYGKLKLEQEHILKDSKLDHVILRLPNIFGYGELENIGNLGVVEKFISRCLYNEDIIIHGTGKQKTSLLHKMDLMNLIQILLKNNIKNEIFNVASELEISVIELSYIIQKIFKEKFSKTTSIRHEILKEKPSNIPLMSSKKLYSKIDWRPSKTDIHEQLERMIR